MLDLEQWSGPSRTCQGRWSWFLFPVPFPFLCFLSCLLLSCSSSLSFVYSFSLLVYFMCQKYPWSDQEKTHRLLPRERVPSQCQQLRCDCVLATADLMGFLPTEPSTCMLPQCPLNTLRNLSLHLQIGIIMPVYMCPEKIFNVFKAAIAFIHILSPV